MAFFQSAGKEEKALLPVWSTVGGTYRLALENIGEFAKMAWLWLALLTPVMAVYTWATWKHMEPALCPAPPSAGVPPQNMSLTEEYLYSLPLALIELFAAASIAVAWHRLILRRERIASKYYLRCDSSVWSYYAVGVFFLLINLPFLALVDLGRDVFPLMCLAGVLLLVIIMRLSVILPARALGLASVTFREVWRRTSWNFWRMFWGYMLSSLPVFLFDRLETAGCGSSVAGPLAYTASDVLSTFVVVPCTLTYLSLSYRHFFERE